MTEHGDRSTSAARCPPAPPCSRPAPAPARRSRSAALVTRYVAEGAAPPGGDAGRHLRPGGQPGAARAGPRPAGRGRAGAGRRRRPPTADDQLIALLAGRRRRRAGRRAASRLREALAAFDAATIATTHQFCQLVLRSLGVAGDTDPGVDAWSRTSTTWSSEVVDDLYLAALRPAGRPAAVRPRRRADPRPAGPSATRRPGWPPATPSPAPRPAARVAFAARRPRGGRAPQAPARHPQLRRPAQPARRRARGRPTPRPGSGCGSRWRIVLVDEFQDTDPVQWEMHRPGVRRPRHAGPDRRPQAGDLRLPRRRRRHLPHGGRDGRPAGPTLGTNWRSDQALRRPAPGGAARRRARRPADRRPPGRRRTTTGSRLVGRPRRLAVPGPRRAPRQGFRLTKRQRDPRRPGRARTSPPTAPPTSSALLASGATYDGRAGPRRATSRSSSPPATMASWSSDALADGGVPAVVAGGGSVFVDPGRRRVAGPARGARAAAPLRAGPGGRAHRLPRPDRPPSWTPAATT